MTKCWCGTEAQPWDHPDYDRCPACGTLVLKDSSKLQDYASFYSKDGYWEEHVQTRFGFPTLEERRDAMLPRSEWWWNAIKQVYGGVPASVYELGSAEGTFLTVARKDSPYVLGHDVDPATADYVVNTHDIPCLSGLFPESRPMWVGPNPETQPFDVVCGFDVLEHTPDPVDFLRAAWEHTESVMVFQTPCYREEGPSFKHLKAPEHVFIWTPHSANLLYEKAGIPVNISNAFFMKDMMLWSKK